MAADMNAVQLIGRLTRDPEQRGGGAVTTFRLAFTTREKQGDEWGDKSNFIDTVCFGRTGDMVHQYLTKGRRVGVTGRLSWREWEKDGVKRQSIELVANDVFFLDSNQNAGGGGQVRDELAPDTRGMKPAVEDSSIPF